MAGPGLPTNIAAGGTTTGHKTHTDTIHTYVDKLDTTFLTPTSGKVLTGNGTTWAPADPTSGDIIIREIGDTSIPGGTPTGTLLYTKLPITLKKWDAVGVEDGVTLTTSTVGSGDSAWSLISGSALTVVDGEIVVPNSTSSRTFRWDGFNRDVFGMRFYLRVETASPTSNVNIMNVYDSAALFLFQMTLNTTRQPQLRNAAGTSVWSGTSLTLGKTYRFEVSQATRPQVQVKVYTMADVIHTQSGVQTLTHATAVDRFEIGQQNSIAYGPAYWSHIAVIDTAVDVGPYPAATF